MKPSCFLIDPHVAAPHPSWVRPAGLDWSAVTTNRRQLATRRSREARLGSRCAVSGEGFSKPLLARGGRRCWPALARTAISERLAKRTIRQPDSPYQDLKTRSVADRVEHPIPDGIV